MAIANKTLVAAVMSGLMVVSAGSAMAGGRNGNGGGLNLNFGNKPAQKVTLFSGQNSGQNNPKPISNNPQTFKPTVVKQSIVKQSIVSPSLKQDCHTHDCFPKSHCNPYWGFNYCYTPLYAYTPVVYCDPYKVVGTWRAAPADGIELVITLNVDHTFAWAMSADGKPTVIAGKYSVAGNALTLISGTDGDVIRGTVVNGPAGAINLAFASPADATMALTFAR